MTATCSDRIDDPHDFQPSRLLVEFRSREDEVQAKPPSQLLPIQVCTKCGILRFPDVSKEVLR